MLELFPGGRQGSPDGYMSVFLTRKNTFNHTAPVRIGFSISICNQLKPEKTLKKISLPNSTIPGNLGIDQHHRARVGWDDFMKAQDLVDPINGFLVLGSIHLKAEVVINPDAPRCKLREPRKADRIPRGPTIA